MSDSAVLENTDRIERTIHIRAARSRVWNALTNAREFGKWFGCDLESQAFEPGKSVRGPFVKAGCEHYVFSAVIDRVEPEKLFSYRWHPGGLDPSKYPDEKPTLVTFTLAEADGGTMLTVVESGFDALPPERRVPAWHMNSEGWDAQLGNLDRYASAV